ncbi:rRNA maturation RNase YbeY [Pseudemcibacter aquimaris]|uniref:rRNA maturation RNase YbeY n=1 Tax=Pseudemcibacter aquimaris TaxID=2857064 RepID=UPI0020112ADD|nr:rRNA maturation RNase YbeY [Pseudemcibacter aquimaris]MCC3862349.1 rRNA maturation RNase YbeY [Pseudemcibacter aquimaris]WDU59220.1 rRNA maturation RNase YbeY [Pseudemcibacter aquimaris]
MTQNQGLEWDIAVDYAEWETALPNFHEIIEQSIELIKSEVTEGGRLEQFMLIEVGVVLCDDNLIHELNRDYRNKDKATNVLSFNGLDEDEISTLLKEGEPSAQHPYSLGEIYIAYETVKREADEAGIQLKAHFTHMVIHGLLHLLGYDHIKDNEAEIMEAIEVKLLKKLGIDDPYTT